jgi:hypothetical protein
MERFTPASPTLNIRADLWVQTAKGECLARFVVFEETHLRHLRSGFLAFRANSSIFPPA